MPRPSFGRSRPTANLVTPGARTEIWFAVGECSLGSILVAKSERGICALFLGDDPDALARELQDQFPRATLIGGDVDFDQLVAKIVGFVEAPSLGLDLPLDVRSTAFQGRVWQALRRIPAGLRMSYREIAEHLARKYLWKLIVSGWHRGMGRD